MTEAEIRLQIELNEGVRARAELSGNREVAKTADRMIVYWSKRLTPLVTGENAKTWAELTAND